MTTGTRGEGVSAVDKVCSSASGSLGSNSKSVRNNHKVRKIILKSALVALYFVMATIMINLGSE